MAIYAISDLHLSLGAEKSMDIFEGWENYVGKLKYNWQKVVKNSDTVVIAGDISWAMRLEETKQDFDFINSLPGKKIFLKGNHDYWWSTANKINNFLVENSFSTISILSNDAIVVEEICICGSRGWLYNSESAEDKKILAREVGRLKLSLDCAKEAGLDIIAFLHYPPVYGSQESEEILNLLVERKVKKCYYGHIHGNKANRKVVTGSYKGIELHLISCDYLNFCPVLVN